MVNLPRLDVGQSLLLTNGGRLQLYASLTNGATPDHGEGREAGGQPCAVLCLDCIGNQGKIARYAGVGDRIEIGRFLLFLK